MLHHAAPAAGRRDEAADAAEGIARDGSRRDQLRESHGDVRRKHPGAALEIARAELSRQAPDVAALTEFFDRHNFGPLLRKQADRLASLPLSAGS